MGRKKTGNSNINGVRPSFACISAIRLKIFDKAIKVSGTIYNVSQTTLSLNAKFNLAK